MNRNDWIWVAIRVFGIYLLVLAVVAIPDVVTSWYQVSMFREFQQTLPSQATPESSDVLLSMMRATMKAAGSTYLSSVVRLVLFSIFGFYLMWKGNLLFRIISRQSPPVVQTGVEEQGSSGAGPRNEQE